MMTPLSHNNAIDIARNRLFVAMKRLRRRALLHAGLRGAGWIAGGTTLLFVGMVTALGWWGGTDLRSLSWFSLLTGAVFLTITALGIPLIQYSRRNAIAYRIGKKFPNLFSDVLSASQLAASEDMRRFSESLIVQHFKDVETKLVTIPSNTLFPLKAMLPPAIVLVVAVTISATIYSLIPGVVEAGLESLWTEIRPPTVRTKRLEAKAPVIEDLTITLRYPEYLGREERQVSGVSGGLVAPRGTTILLEGKPLVEDAVRGVIQLSNGVRTPLTLQPNGVAKGKFVLSAAGSFSIALGTREVLMEGPQRALDIEPDDPPSIRILRPLGKIKLQNDGEVNIEFEAEDDHRLRNIDLIIRGVSNLEIRKTIVHLADRVSHVKTQFQWSPDSLRLLGATDLQLELEAYDNDTILGPKPGRTETLHVQIVTPKSRHNTAIKDQIRSLDGLIDLLANRLVNPPPSSRKNEDIKKRFSLIQGSTEDVLARTARLIHLLSQDPLTPKKVTDAFVQIRQDISNQLLYESRLHEEARPDYKQRNSLDRVTIRILESAIVRLDDLIAEQQIAQVVQEGGALESQHNALARLFSSFAKTRAESSRRSILELISQLEENIKQLHKNMEEIRGKVEDTFVNPSSLRPLDLLGALQMLRRLLATEDIEAAEKLVASLEADLGRLMAGLEGGLLSFRTRRFGEAEMFLGGLFERIMAIEANQLQLRRETTALKRRYQERLVTVMKGRIDPLVQNQLQRVKQIRKILETGDLTHPSVSLRAQIARIRVTLRELELALGQGDLDESRQTADQLVEFTEELLSDSDGRGGKKFDEVLRFAEKMLTDMIAAYPRPAHLLTKRDRRLASGQAMSQRALLRKTRKVRGWAETEGEVTRFLSLRAMRALQTVSSHMSAAVYALEQESLRKAIFEQSAALEELTRLREDLKHGNEVAPLESRPILLKGQVELPNPDDFEVPPEFRKDILEAMDEDVPRQYGSSIRKYYETLVQ